MNIAIFNPIMNNLSLDSMLKKLKSLNVEYLELGVGGYPGKAHANAKLLLEDKKEFEVFVGKLDKYGIKITALSVHGNPLHPNKEIAQVFHEDFVNACKLANQLRIDKLVTFSGCPGDHDGAKYPNWVTCPWPEDFLEILKYQWDKLEKYWVEAVKLANNNGVTKIALEMHPGFCVYNPETLVKLRSLVGPTIGANFDPSHLIWQGIDAVSAIKYLNNAIYHFHAKDTEINKEACAVNGVLDTKRYTDELNRSWIFRTVGYGNDAFYWKKLISTLQLIGYDGEISIEHEDSLMEGLEGLEKAVIFLKDIVIKGKKPGSINWA